MVFNAFSIRNKKGLMPCFLHLDEGSKDSFGVPRLLRRHGVHFFLNFLESLATNANEISDPDYILNHPFGKLEDEFTKGSLDFPQLMLGIKDTENLPKSETLNMGTIAHCSLVMRFIVSICSKEGSLKYNQVFDRKTLRLSSRGKNLGVLAFLDESWLFGIGKLSIRNHVAVAAKESPPLYLEDLHWEFFRLVDEIAKIQDGPGYKHALTSMHVPYRKYLPGKKQPRHSLNPEAYTNLLRQSKQMVKPNGIESLWYRTRFGELEGGAGNTDLKENVKNRLTKQVEEKQKASVNIAAASLMGIAKGFDANRLKVCPASDKPNDNKKQSKENVEPSDPMEDPKDNEKASEPEKGDDVTTSQDARLPRKQNVNSKLRALAKTPRTTSKHEEKDKKSDGEKGKVDGQGRKDEEMEEGKEEKRLKMNWKTAILKRKRTRRNQVNWKTAVLKKTPNQVQRESYAVKKRKRKRKSLVNLKIAILKKTPNQVQREPYAPQMMRQGLVSLTVAVVLLVSA